MKVAIVYTSTTGNTEAMANAINEQAVANGAEVVFGTPDAVDAGAVLSSDVIILGSPAMGDEVLEEDSFEPFFAEAEAKLDGVPVALFGSYGWGGKLFDLIGQLLAPLKLDMVSEPLLVKGQPKAEDFKRLDEIAKAIAEKHKSIGL